MNETEKHKIFFPELDGLRFFSFFIVFCSHIFATDNVAIKNTTWYQFFKVRLFLDGDIGVSFFFVLSGFLITYLLIKEKEFTGKIHVGKFYARRALRIWPLYYFCVFFGFILFPYFKMQFGQVSHETADPFLCSTFLNNFNAIKNGPPDASVLSVLWSVAIEEQFYLLWPLLLFFIPSKYYSYIFLAIISGSLIYRGTHLSGMIETNTLGVISDMAIGGFAAYLSIHSRIFLKKIENCNPFFHLIPYLAVLVFIGFKYQLFSIPFMVIFKRVIVAFFFAWIILEQNFSKRSLFKISRLKRISALGKYTYGLYCLHVIAILITMTLLHKFGLDQQSWQLWLFQFPLAMGLSIFISYFSYKILESPFLKLKDRFAFIVKS